MDTKEYQHWMKVTQSSQSKWVYDDCMFHNSGIHFFYKGGESGNYIQVKPDGTAEIGTYQFAIPHIGEAAFTVKHSKKLADNANKSLSIVLEKMGMQFLIDFITPSL